MCVKYTLQKDGHIVKCVDFNGFNDQYNYIIDFIKENKFGTPQEVNERDNFFGEHSLRQTLDGMNYGFEQETKYFLNSIETTSTKENSYSGVHMDTNGFAYDMGSFVSGVPECCINMDLPVPTPYVKILVDIVYPCSFSARNILNRGIGITNLVTQLLANGFIVDLYALDFNVQDDMCTMYTNKIDTHTLSISNIAFMSSPEYFRKLGFITIDVIRNKQSQGGRGQSYLLPFMVNKIQKQKIFYIGGGYTDTDLKHRCETPLEATKYMLEKFNTYAKDNKIYVNFKMIDKKDNK